MPKYQFVVLLPTVEADTEEKAKVKVMKLLENLERDALPGLVVLVASRS